MRKVLLVGMQPTLSMEQADSMRDHLTKLIGYDGEIVVIGSTSFVHELAIPETKGRD